MKMLSCSILAAGALFASGAARADEPDPSKLYQLATDGSTAHLKAGERGKWVLAIQPAEGAHVSDDAPMRIELQGTHLKPDKEKLARADSVTKGASPRFEVPFTAAEAGQGSVVAKLTFFICTDKICARQQREVSVPVDVN
jgi:hypothetical protein